MDRAQTPRRGPDIGGDSVTMPTTREKLAEAIRRARATRANWRKVAKADILVVLQHLSEVAEEAVESWGILTTTQAKAETKAPAFPVCPHGHRIVGMRVTEHHSGTSPVYCVIRQEARIIGGRPEPGFVICRSDHEPTPKQVFWVPAFRVDL